MDIIDNGRIVACNVACYHILSRGMAFIDKKNDQRRFKSFRSTFINGLYMP